jgi:16S rRNA processing protein RimM
MNIKKAKKTGKVLKAHGKKGEIFISSEYNLPDNFQKLESIFIAIDELLVPFFMEEINLKSSKTAAIKLEDIDTVEEATELAELDWYLSEKDFYWLFDQPADNANELIGYQLIDQHEAWIGEITGIQEIPSNTLLIVKSNTQEYDIPFNEETLLGIDNKKKIIQVEIPEGLLNL